MWYAFSTSIFNYHFTSIDHLEYQDKKQTKIDYGEKPCIKQQQWDVLQKTNTSLE